MATLPKQAQQEAQRGLIVKVLADWQLEWMPSSELQLQFLRRAGYRLADTKLEFHLKYLSAAGYLETKQLRAAHAGLELTAVRATTKAVDWVEGRIPPDPALGD